MPDVVDHLHERARLIAHACRDIPDGLLWRWHNYDWHTPLHIGRMALREGDTLADYRRAGDPQAALYLGSIRPLEQLADQKIEEIPVGPAKVEDGVSMPFQNWEGLAPLPCHYEATFEHSRSREDALAIGFTQSVTASIEVEKTVKVGLEVGFEARQDRTHTEGSSDSESRTAGLDPTCPPGCDITFRMQRVTQPTKLRVTGKAQLEHSVMIGKHNYGRWQKHPGAHGRMYDRHLHWDTFTDFVKTIQGEGRRDHRATTFFQKHPAPRWLVDRLLEPLAIPYSAETPVFAGWTKLSPMQTLVRGPNPAIMAKLRQMHSPEDED